MAGEATHAVVFAEDDTRPQKPDARHDVGRNPRRVVAHVRRDNRKQSRSYANQRNGAQSGRFAAVFAFGTDEGTGQQGIEQFEKVVVHE